MKLKKNIIFKILILKHFTSLFGEVIWVNYGWELFEHVTNARISSLGNSTIAYDINSSAAAILNPSIINYADKNFELTHHSRFAGVVNSDIFGGQLFTQKSTSLVYNLLYEGVSKIPNTQSALLDWGMDGVFNTQDKGEGNGVLDEGERLDVSSINFFSQHQIGVHFAFMHNIGKTPIGIGTKLLCYSLNKHTAIGLGMDLGMIKNVKKINLGFTLKNVPSSGLIWDNGTIEATSPTFAFGMHAPYVLKKVPLEFHTLSCLEISAKNRHLNNQFYIGNINLNSSVGIEIVYDSKIFFRFGQNQMGSGTGGLGLRWPAFTIDYSFEASDRDSGLGNNHLFTVSIFPDWIREYLKSVN